MHTVEKSLKFFAKKSYDETLKKDYTVISLILEILYPFLIGKQGSFLTLLDPNQSMKIISVSTKKFLIVNKPTAIGSTRLTGPAKEFMKYIIPLKDWSTNNRLNYQSCKNPNLSLNNKSTCAVLKIRNKFVAFQISKKKILDQKINFMARPNMNRSYIKELKKPPFNLCDNKKNGVCHENYENCSLANPYEICWIGQEIDIKNNTIFDDYIHQNAHKQKEYKLQRTAYTMRGFANYQLNKQLVAR